MASALDDLINKVSDFVRRELGLIIRDDAAPAVAPKAPEPEGDVHPLAPLIDQTLLKATATEEQIRDLCRGAREHQFASVCVNSCWVKVAREELKGSKVRVCTVVGFPLGAMDSGAKAYEAAEAVKNGADEIDMVLPIGPLIAGDMKTVHRDIEKVVLASEGRTVKVIIETAYLNDEQKVAACVVARLAGANFVKTSTGFAGKGATVEDVALMRRTVGQVMGVKASGGIRDEQTAQAMVGAGASRLGVSAGVEIVTGGKSEGTY